MTRLKILRWPPRLLAILVLISTGLFALDVFSEGLGFIQTIITLFMHLVPQFLILIALFIAWRWPRIGAGIFLGLGMLSLLFFSDPFASTAHLILTLPMFVISGLFILQCWVETKSTDDDDIGG